MAKLIVDLPRDWEAKVVQDQKGARIEIEPGFVTGSAAAPCLYLTSRGKGGLERKTVIMLNGNTGWIESRRIKEGQQSCDFDLTPEEFEKKNAKDGNKDAD